MRSLLVLTVLCVSSDALAKPLYVTVQRTFSTKESPELEVSYSESAPVELRVLRPQSVDAFVQAHRNLRRAYEVAPTLVNPGHYLALGLNEIVSPMGVLRRALNVDTRKAIGKGFSDEEATSTNIARFHPGVEKLAGTPPGMVVVKREWLNLDLGGAERDFTVPGYETEGGTNYEDRRVTLMPLPPGIYVVQLVQGMIEAQVTMVVSNLVAQVKQSHDTVLVRVAERRGGPASKASVEIWDGSEKRATLQTDENGEARASLTGQKLIVVAKRGDDATLVDTDHYASIAATPNVFVYTDRPLYRPGDRIRYRGVVRQPQGFWQSLFATKATTVKLALEPGGGVQDVPLDDFGTFSGELLVPKNADDMVRLVATLEGTGEHQAEARVMEYVKPTYYAELSSDDDTITPGTTLSVKVKAKRYAGGAPKKVRYEYFLYRTQLDTPSWVDDAGLGGKGSAVTYGTVSTSEGRLNVPERLVSSMELRESFGDNHWDDAPTLDKKGEGSFEVTVPPLQPGDERLNYKYSVQVKLVDGAGEEAQARKAFVFAACDVSAAVRFDRAAYGPTQDIVVAVRSTTPTGRAVPSITGQLKVSLEKVDGSSSVVLDQEVKTDGSGTARVPVKATGPGRLYAEVVLKDSKGREDGNNAHALLLGRGAEAVQDVPTLTATALSEIVEPDSEATIVAMFPDKWAEEAAGHVWVTLSGSNVFESTRLTLHGHTLSYKFDADRRYGSSIYAEVAYVAADGHFEERSVPVRLITAERLLSLSVEPQRIEAPPLGEQVVRLTVTDSKGAPVRAQVSVSVVDKAVYAIAPEFRPRIEAFFYPPARLGVSTFQSADFQGYGYGEVLARLRRAKAFDFADIKSPSNVVEAKEDDTIYWNAAIATDASGFAELRFNTPRQPAMFQITAVAIDKSGRFAEERSEFATRSASAVAAFAPSFLREGDSATAQVRLQSKKPDKGQLQVTSSGALKEMGTSVDLMLDGKEEQIVPVPLAATKQGAGSVRLSWAGANKVADLRSVDVLPPDVPVSEIVTSAAGGDLTFSGTPVSTVEVAVLPTLGAMVMAEARQLLAYPYGCLEQLIATTVPNVALADWLGGLQKMHALDQAGERLLAEARSRGVAGVSRILRLQQPTGGFTWFDGYTTPSFAMTLIALEGLSYVAKVGELEVGKVEPSLQWIASQSDVPVRLDALRAYVLARFHGASEAPRIRQVLARSEDDLVALSYLKLAAIDAGLSQDAELNAKFAVLASAARDRSRIHDAVYREAYYQMPMGEIGVAALVAHAALGDGSDLALAKTLLTEALSRPQSTLSLSTLLLHLAPVLKAEQKQLLQQKAPDVEANGKTIAMSKGPLGFSATLPAGTKQVKVSSSGEGVVSLRAMTVGSTAQAASGLSVTRKYFLLADKQRRELGASDTLKVGDEIYVELQLDTIDDGHTASAYTVLADAVPAGFSVLREDRVFEGAPHSLPLRHESMKKREIGRDRITFFFESPAHWSKSPRTIGYVMRADFAGQFKAPPATFTDMYDALRVGRSASASMRVQ